MSSAGVDAFLFEEPPSTPTVSTRDAMARSVAGPRHAQISGPAALGASAGPRRTPRKSLIVVLSENHIVSPDVVASAVPEEDVDDSVDVILACAGPPLGITALQRKVRDLQILLAPAGTSNEDLRELAMSQASGDIVTLLSGSPARA